MPDSDDLVQAIERHPEINRRSRLVREPLYYRRCVHSTELLFDELMNASDSLRSLFGILSSLGESFTALRALHGYSGGNIEGSLWHGWHTNMSTITVSTLPNLLLVLIDQWNDRCRLLDNIPHEIDFARVAASIDPSAGNTRYRLIGLVRGSWYSSRHSFESVERNTNTESLGLTAVLFERF